MGKAVDGGGGGGAAVKADLFDVCLFSAGLKKRFMVSTVNSWVRMDGFVVSQLEV
jgi:hypothetical protein